MQLRFIAMTPRELLHQRGLARARFPSDRDYASTPSAGLRESLLQLALLFVAL
jgi:hypothetical protein